MTFVDQIPGARWWKVDFHAHSPSSFDFGAEEGSASQSKVDVTEWLVAYMAAGLDAVVIADHNSHSGIDAAIAALDDLRTSTDPRYRELVIFPGVEITTASGYHLLGVFDPATPSDVINGVLHKCDFKGTRGTSDATTVKSFEEVVDLIVADGGLAIPAHADGPAGLFGMDLRDIQGIERQGLISAIEMVGVDLKMATDRQWVPILGSDAHHLDSATAPDPALAKFPGSHFTWTKVGALDLAGMRMAISDGSSSLRRSTTHPENPNLINHAALVSLVVSHKGERMEYSLSPWMNAIIGGRGTGKSTVVEMLRLALGRFDEMPEKLRDDLEWFSPHSRSDADRRAWDKETEIEVVYRRLGNLYRILWNGSSPQTPTIELQTDGLWIQQEGLVSERFPLLINSQKQIYEMASDPQSLLRLIDQQPELDHATWRQKHEALTLQYRTQRAEIEEVRNRISEESRLRGNLADAELLVEKLGKLRDSDEAKELDQLRVVESEFARAEELATSLEMGLTAALEQYRTEVELASFPAPTWDAEARRRRSVEAAVAQVVSAVKALSDSRFLLETERRTSDPRRERLLQLSAELQTSSEPAEPVQSGGVSATDSSFESATARRLELTKALDGISRDKTRMTELEQGANETLDAVEKHRAELTERRRVAIDALKSGDFEIKLFPQADMSGIERSLRHITQRSSAFDALFGDQGLPSLLGKNVFDPKYADSVSSVKTLLKDLRVAGKDSLLLADYSGSTVDARFIQHLETLDGVQFEADVDLWFPEDRLQVRYRQEGSANLKPIDEGSPGQKTAALLALILQFGTQPLVLDQPEDDLDNLLIYDLVVRSLRKAKLNRQILVVTHNANIVVNADAELVTVLKHGVIPVVEHSASIQAVNVRDSICKIMEGGETAFQARYRRLLSRV